MKSNFCSVEWSLLVAYSYCSVRAALGQPTSLTEEFKLY